MERLLMQEMTWAEVEARFEESGTVIIPMGSTEQHGHHLPLGVDTFIPIYAAEKISQKTGVPVVPPIWFSTCEHHMCFPGTITIRPTTLMLLVKDVCTSLYKHGVRDIIILNGHTSGANSALLCAAEEMQTDIEDLRLWIVDVVKMAWEAINKVCEAEILFHADEVEASQMLVIREDLVWLEKAKKIIPEPKSKFVKVDYRESGDQVLCHFPSKVWRQQITPQGQVGDPNISSKEKGEAILNALIKNVVDLINEISRGKTW